MFKIVIFSNREHMLWALQCMTTRLQMWSKCILKWKLKHLYHFISFEHYIVHIHLVTTSNYLIFLKDVVSQSVEALRLAPFWTYDTYLCSNLTTHWPSFCSSCAPSYLSTWNSAIIPWTYDYETLDNIFEIKWCLFLSIASTNILVFIFVNSMIKENTLLYCLKNSTILSIVGVVKCQSN
jgi:hypothetical protein